MIHTVQCPEFSLVNKFHS